MAEVVDRGALGVDALVEHLDDGVAERLDLRALQRADRPQRVDAGDEERLVRVDVADARDSLLVQDERLDGLLALPGLGPQRLGGEVGA